MKTSTRKHLNWLFTILILTVTLPAGYFLYGHRNSADTSWVKDMGYQKEDLHSLTFNRRGKRSVPLIPVVVGGQQFPVIFDTGCGTGISFTNAIEQEIEFTLESKVESLNRDGSHRGWSKSVRIPQVNVFGHVFENVSTTISDWSMYSSHPFNGLIGLEYFNDKIITLDYKARKIAVKGKPLVYKSLNEEHYTILPLSWSDTPGQTYLPFFLAELNNEPVMVYLDTGKNHSYIYNPTSPHSILNKPRHFTNSSIQVGGHQWPLKNVVEVHDMAQSDGLPYPTRAELNSDQLWKLGLVVTFDMQENKIIFRK